MSTDLIKAVLWAGAGSAAVTAVTLALTWLLGGAGLAALWAGLVVVVAVAVVVVSRLVLADDDSVELEMYAPPVPPTDSADWGPDWTEPYEWRQK